MRNLEKNNVVIIVDFKCMGEFKFRILSFQQSSKDHLDTNRLLNSYPSRSLFLLFTLITSDKKYALSL
jgi:hypothetical protein